MTITEIDTSAFREGPAPLQDELAADLDATALLQLIRDAQ